ncbi:MAG: flavodoxin domain-containing protein [Anaerolineaceae bacterium]|nr:flavodoxin domain-containing protein [Anaerolineaceae bacterium]
MSESVLITYATRYGSTKEVAEKIAQILIHDEFEVEVLPCKKVDTIEQYQFIVIGAPYYIGGMLKDAKNFLLRNQDMLSKKPVAFFALGPIGETEKELTETQNQLDKELKQFPWFKPISTVMFGGKYNPKKLRLLDKFLTLPPASPLHNLAANDARNWEDIKNWAEKITASLISIKNPSIQ